MSDFTLKLTDSETAAFFRWLTEHRMQEANRKARLEALVEEAKQRRDVSAQRVSEKPERPLSAYANDLIAILLGGARISPNQVHTHYHTNSSPEYDSVTFRGEFDLDNMAKLLKEYVDKSKKI